MLTNLKKICNHPWLWGLDGEARGALGLGEEAGLEEEALLDPQHSGGLAGRLLCCVGWPRSQLLCAATLCTHFLQHCSSASNGAPPASQPPAPMCPLPGKMAALSILLQRCLGAGDRVVVVSQSTAALDLISQHCDAKVCRAPWGLGSAGMG